MTDKPLISDIAFTPEVKAAQEENQSRSFYQAAMEERDWLDHVTQDLRVRLAEADSLYLATVGSDGHPYIQHRGGPRGFLVPLDDRRLAFADFSGNQQYVSLGNLATNNKAHIFIMDYANKQRVKLWGNIEVSEATPALVEKLTHPSYLAKVERVLIFTLSAWDLNCPQHIPHKVDIRDVKQAITQLTMRVKELEEENAELRSFVK